MMIDTHCHLEKKDYSNIEEIVKKMENNLIIVSGHDDETNKEVLELIERFPNIYGTIGIHPEDIDGMTNQSFKIIENNVNNPKIVGIGEIGLDYHWNKENKQQQQDIFIKQIELANVYHKPIVVHSREAINETYNILKKYLKTKAVIHCYSSSLEMAYKFIGLGIKLGIGGVLTFKNSKVLKEVVKDVDLKHLLLETDSPYLTPEPYRGKKNEPYNVIYVAEKIADIKGLAVEEVLEATTNNALEQFDLNN